MIWSVNIRQKRLNITGMTDSEDHNMIDTENYFDAIVSVDAYHYFGCKEGVFVYKEEIKTALYMALTCL